MKKLCYLIPLLFMSLAACTEARSTKTKKYKENHTLKLQKNISVDFKKIDLIVFNFQPDHTAKSIKIFSVDGDKKKNLLIQKAVLTSGHLNLSLPEDIKAYKYLVALVEATDQNEHKISAVTTYKIGEQDQINAAKNNYRK